MGGKNSGKSKARNMHGSSNPMSKLSEEDVWFIRRMRAGAGNCRSTDPRSTSALAERFGVTKSQISKIALNRQWGHHTRGAK